MNIMKVTTILAAPALLATWGILLSVGCLPCVGANLAITGLSLQNDFSALDSTETGNSPTTITYQNDITAIATFAAGGNTYMPAGFADQVFIRRNNVSSNQSSIWSASTTTVGTVRGPDKENYGQLLNANNILTGTDNLFVNGTTGVDVGNIERMDLVFTAGKVVTGADAVAVFDRGAVNGHDQVRVALITSLGLGVNSPLTWVFGSTVLISSVNYGTTNPVGDFNYNIGRYSAGDDLSTHTSMNANGTQGIGGVAVPLLDLGITASTTIYGYALMGADVTVALADWTIAANYPTNTSPSNGGLDAVAVNGIIFKHAPEPTSLSLALASLAFFTRRRPRR